MEKVTWMGWGRHQGSQGQECDQVYMGQGCLVQLAKVQGQGQGKRLKIALRYTLATQPGREHLVWPSQPSSSVSAAHPHRHTRALLANEPRAGQHPATVLNHRLRPTYARFPHGRTSPAGLRSYE